MNRHISCTCVRHLINMIDPAGAAAWSSEGNNGPAIRRNDATTPTQYLIASRFVMIYCFFCGCLEFMIPFLPRVVIHVALFPCSYYFTGLLSSSSCRADSKLSQQDLGS